MMGPMMGGSSGWQPMLIILVILMAVVVAAAIALTRAGRPAGPASQFRPRKPGRPNADGRPIAGDGPGEDPLIILRERYAHGEIGHAEFIHVLDQLLRAGESPHTLPPKNSH